MSFAVIQHCPVDCVGSNLNHHETFSLTQERSRLVDLRERILRLEKTVCTKIDDFQRELLCVTALLDGALEHDDDPSTEVCFPPELSQTTDSEGFRHPKSSARHHQWTSVEDTTLQRAVTVRGSDNCRSVESWKAVAQNISAVLGRRDWPLWIDCFQRWFAKSLTDVKIPHRTLAPTCRDSTEHTAPTDRAWCRSACWAAVGATRGDVVSLTGLQLEELPISARFAMSGYWTVNRRQTLTCVIQAMSMHHSALSSSDWLVVGFETLGEHFCQATISGLRAEWDAMKERRRADCPPPAEARRRMMLPAAFLPTRTVRLKSNIRTAELPKISIVPCVFGQRNFVDVQSELRGPLEQLTPAPFLAIGLLRAMECEDLSIAYDEGQYSASTPRCFAILEANPDLRAEVMKLLA